jgi:hypothetical protein
VLSAFQYLVVFLNDDYIDRSPVEVSAKVMPTFHFKDFFPGKKPGIDFSKAENVYLGYTMLAKGYTPTKKFGISIGFFPLRNLTHLEDFSILGFPLQVVAWLNGEWQAIRIG